MVASCSAFGCKSRHQKEVVMSFHRFPLKNEGLLKTWLLAIKRKNFTPTKYSFLCGKHFAEDDFLQRPSGCSRKLKPLAVPSVFPELPKSFQPTIKSMQKTEAFLKAITPLSPKSIEQASRIFDDQHETKSIEAETVASQKSVDVYVQTREITLPTTVNKLKHQKKILQQKLRRQNRTIANQKTLIDTLKKQCALDTDLEHLLQDQFTGFTKDIVLHLLKNNDSISNAGHRYSIEIKTFALALHCSSPKAYEFCRSILKLPHRSSLSSWTSDVNECA